MVGHNRQDLMPELGKLLGDVERVNSTARALQWIMVRNENFQGRNLPGCEMNVISAPASN